MFSSSPRLFAALTTFILVATLVPASAVAQTTIYVDDDASGANDGSESDPYTALQEALSDAASTSGAVEIRVAGGIYYPDEGPGIPDGKADTSFVLSGDLTLKGGYAGDFGSRDPDANVTVLSGDIGQDDATNSDGVVTDTADISGTNSTHVLRAQQINGIATLDGLTITAGQANDSQSDTGLREGLNGGGLISRSSDVVLNNVTVRGNYTAGDPGGGGGLFSDTDGDDFGAEPGSLAVTNSTLRGNAGRQGGAVRVQDGPLVLRNTTVRNNQARTDGGGVVASNRTELTDVTFRNNTTVSGNGGGFYFAELSESTVRFQTVTFDGNKAGGEGGGAFVEAPPGPQLTDVTFRNNSAEGGNAGGLYLNNFFGSSGGLQNATFENNTAEAAEGGAMVCFCTLPITNTTFRNNSAGANGGAVLATGGVTFDGVLFENNSTGGDGGALDISRSSTSQQGWVLRDVVFRGNSSDATGTGDTNGGGALAASANPFAPSGVDGQLRNVRFVNNESGEDGGAMMITLGGEYELRNVDFIDNVTGGDFGGEGAALVTEDATAELVNAEVRGNDGPGGVIEAKGDASDKGTNRLTNVVLADNGTETAGSGVVRNSGGITILNNVVVASNGGSGLVNRSLAGSSMMTVHNSIVYDNNGGLGVYEINNGEGDTIDVQNTLVRGGLTGEHVNNEGTVNDNGGNISGNPMFVDPSNGDYHLQSGSPAVDAGDDGLLPSDSLDLDADGDTTEALPYDLDRSPRTEGPVDLGPYETGSGPAQFTTQFAAGATEAGVPDSYGLDLTFQTLSTSTVLDVTYDGAATSDGLGLPGEQGLAITSLWTLDFSNPAPDTSEIEATLCFDIENLFFRSVDRSVLNVYARSDSSATDWEKRTPTELRPSGANPVAVCVSGQSRFSQFAVTAKKSELPVELIAFEAQTDANTVRLSWTTASETNNAGFEVQRQADGAESWTDVGFVEGAGTTTEPQQYRFSVGEPLAPGTHRFRLRQVDADGTAHFSAPVTATVDLQQPVRLSAPAPNPVQNQATLSFAVKQTAQTTLTLYNVLGQRVATLYRGTPTAGESQTVSLSAADLSSGVYFVRLRAGERTTTRRLTVVR